MQYARKLKKGDKVAIVSLSSGMLGEEFCSHNIEIGVKRLKEYGLEPVFMPNALKGIEYLQTHPQARAKDLKDAFLDRGNVFKTLSEGEKMVISFLYFMELCKGETTIESSTTGKIVVIDDPISSLSHIYVFNIGRLIHNEFLRTKKYEQIFVLTHSLYFFYELTNTNHKEREETQKLIRLCKNADGSSFVSMKYEEIQNDYQAYWQIVKDRAQAPALIANCMRNIIEYFFNFVEKLDFPQVFQKPELQDIRFLAFNRYMNRESHSKGQNIFDIKEFDYDSFRDAFKLVFEIEGYPEHYQKMMK